MLNFSIIKGEKKYDYFLYKLGNPLTCDCETLWLRQWVADGNIVQDDPRCYFPKGLSGSPLRILRISRFTCSRSEESNFIQDACTGIPLKLPAMSNVQHTIASNEGKMPSYEKSQNNIFSIEK